MISKSELQYYSSLLKKKERREKGKFLAEGRRIVEEGLKSSFVCETVLISHDFESSHPEFISRLAHEQISIRFLSSREFEKISDTETPQGIAAVFHIPESDDQSPESRAEFIVALENISDPGNAGTIIRTGDWFGIKEMIFSENSVEIFNPKVIRSSMGSVFHMKLKESKSFLDELKSLKSRGYKILCADMQGENIYSFSMEGRAVIVFSNEAGGPADEVLSLADNILTIPRLGLAESLNVAAASAVILSELTKP